MSSQLRFIACGHGAGDRLLALGLDYAGAEAGLRLAGRALDPEGWAGLRLMEGAAVAALNEVRA